MKKRFIALFLSALLIFSISPAVYSGAADDDAAFYEELSELLKSQDDSIYFGSLTHRVCSHKSRYDKMKEWN